ncbi:MAG: PLP-dependent aminotransferase family protein [Burkholderiales bacterium]|nr:PLP-dependent aminotransferase family protein [Burkholderiales bacterium]
MGQSTSSTTSARSRANGAGRRLYEHVRAQMADGRLNVGDCLPSTRAHAAELGVSRTTVSAVYDQLAAEGFIVTSPGRAARVAAGASPPGSPRHSRAARRTGRVVAPLSAFGHRVQRMALPAVHLARPHTFDFLYGAVGSRDFPSVAWRRAYLAALWDVQPRLYYAPPEGDEGLRRAVSAYLARARGLQCTHEQIIVVHGSQQAIDLCARVLLDPDDAFVFEDPGYLMARRCFEATGARGLFVSVDEQGLDTRGLPADRGVKLAYVTPSHQFPLGGTLPMARREALLAWARRQRAWIVEDDYDGEFRYGQRPIDALASLDVDGRVIYVGTFSKALSPQLRLGYLVLPPALVAVFRRAKQLIDRHAPLLEQRAMATLIDSGVYERHVRRGRRENERRRVALLNAIAQHLPSGTQILGAAAGLHVVVRVPGIGPSDGPGLVASAARKGVGIYLLAPLFAHARRQAAREGAGLVLGYASLSIPQIDAGVRRLGEAVKEVRAMPRISRRA